MHQQNGASDSLTEPGTERTLDLVADWRFDHDSAIGQFYLRLTGLRTETAGERRSMVSGTGKEVRMRRRVRPSAIAVGAVFVLLVALVAPAGAAPPNNPFVGSWESIYLDESNEIGELLGERELRFQIGGGEGHIHGTANPTGICYGQYGEIMRSSSLGWGTITSEDPYVFEGFVDVYCHTEEGKQLAFEDFRLEYEYDPDTDTLIALHYPETAQITCLWRSGSGSDPSVCP